MVRKLLLGIAFVSLSQVAFASEMGPVSVCQINAQNEGTETYAYLATCTAISGTEACTQPVVRWKLSSDGGKAQFALAQSAFLTSNRLTIATTNTCDSAGFYTPLAIRLVH